MDDLFSKIESIKENNQSMLNNLVTLSKFDLLENIVTESNKQISLMEQSYATLKQVIDSSEKSNGENAVNQDKRTSMLESKVERFHSEMKLIQIEGFNQLLSQYNAVKLYCESSISAIVSSHESLFSVVNELSNHLDVVESIREKVIFILIIFYIFRIKTKSMINLQSWLRLIRRRFLTF